MCRNNPQLTDANHLCAFTSLAPEFDPSRLCSSLINNFLIADLHRLIISTDLSAVLSQVEFTW